MAINFPSSPTLNQLYTVGTRTWSWNGSGWKLESTTSGAWTKKTSSYTAVAGDKIIADTSGGSFTITLPATPSTADAVCVVDGDSWQTHNLTIGRNSSTIEGLSEDFIIDIKGITISFVYDGSTWELFTSGGTTAAAKGGNGDQVFFENGTTVSADYSITSGMNAMSAGPIVIANAASVTIPAGSTWTIV